MQIIIAKADDLDAVVVDSYDEYSRIWWMTLFNFAMLQWVFCRMNAEYRQWHPEAPVNFVRYRYRYAVPLTGWIDWKRKK